MSSKVGIKVSHLVKLSNGVAVFLSDVWTPVDCEIVLTMNDVYI